MEHTKKGRETTEDMLMSRFKSNALSPQVNWLNDFLTKLLESQPNLKKVINLTFDLIAVNSPGTFKRFTIGKWNDDITNSTLDIVLIDGEYKFAITHFGMLYSLGQKDCDKPHIKTTLMDLFINPEKYYKQN